MIKIIFTTVVSGFALTIMSCTTSTPVLEPTYTIYFNSPNIMRLVQPWPLEEKAAKSFTFRSPDVDALFMAPVESGKVEDTQLFYPNDHKFKGQLRIERDELTTKIIRPHTSDEAVYIDRRGGAWRGGTKVDIQRERIEIVIRQIELEQKRHPARR